MSAERKIRMQRPGFGARIIIAFVLVVLLSQLGTMAIVGIAVDRNIEQQLDERLEVGGRVWRDYIDSRGGRFQDAVTVLADHPAFRKAMATGNIAVARQALVDHGRGIGAQVSVLLAIDGSLHSNAPGLPAAEVNAVAAPLLTSALRSGGAVTIAMLQGQLYQFALVPVRSSGLVGWVLMGQRLERVAAQQLKDLIGLDVAFVTRHPVLRVHGATLPVADMMAMLASARTAESQSRFQLRELNANGASNDPVRVVLVADRLVRMELFGPLERELLLLTAAMTSLALVVALLVGRSVGRPVVRLSLAAQRIGAGDYTQPLPVQGNDELSGLASTFNRMQHDLKAREARIRHQASHDSLTGLPNRSQAQETVGAAIARAQSAEGRCAVLILNIDRFKEINDVLGYAFGDEVLVAVAQRLRNAAQPRELLARLGGDEFLAILEGADEADAMKHAQSLLQSLATPILLLDTQISLEASIGVAVFPEHAADAPTLLRRADTAMYEAKEWRSRIVAYQPGHDERHLRQITVMGELRRAVERGELHVVFQPKIDLRTQRVAHVEALLRWTHPVHGKIAPDEFIPLAEHSGLIHQLTVWMLDAALRQAAPWINSGRIEGVAVNLSPLDLVNAGLPEIVAHCLQQHGLAPSCLVLEITESTVMRDVGTSLATMHRLRDVGVRLSIDDFGTGHSSLAQLRGLPVHEIKIDKSFITALGRGGDPVIVRSAIEIGHNMGLIVIAEGVEDAICLDLLRRLGCDMVQGYFFSPPLDGVDFIAWHDRFRDDAGTLKPLLDDQRA